MRDDEHQRTAKALARETKMSDASAARIEEQLLTAMSAPRSAGAGSGNDARKWLAAAALIGFIAGGLALWKVSPSSVDRTITQRSVSKDIVLGVSAKADVVTTAKPPERAHSKPAVQSIQTARVVRPNGFVELPWTAGLPAFESGEIVRVEVPVASLPAYGFDISRGTNRSVEADVLVGQDGLARAMRLVTNSARSTQ